MSSGTPAQRFWRYVKKTKTCWLWQGARGRDGYGHFHVSPKQRAVGAHRVSWWLKYGRWPTLDVLHKTICTSKLCVRPSHLYEGDDFDNCADKRKVGIYKKWKRGSESPFSKLTAEQVDHIRSVLRTDGRGAGQRMAVFYGVGNSTISRIKRGQRY